MTIVLILSGCQGLSEHKDHAALDLLQILRKNNAVFLPIAGSPRKDPHPEKKIGILGAITEFLGVEHPILGKSYFQYQGRKPRVHGSADMTFSGPSGEVQLSQETDSRDTSTWDALATSLWEFGRLLYPDLQPAYCTLDQLGDDEWTNVWELELNYIYWRNIFGPRYVRQFGRDFFMKAPGWKVEKLADDGIMYIPEESYVQWVCSPGSSTVKSAIEYFQQKFPKIEQYRPKEVELPSGISRMILTHASGKKELIYERDKSPKKGRGSRKQLKHPNSTQKRGKQREKRAQAPEAQRGQAPKPPKRPRRT